MVNPFRTTLDQIMFCRRFCTKPLPWLPKLAYRQLDHEGHILMKFQPKYRYFRWQKCIRKCRIQSGGHSIAILMCSFCSQFQDMEVGVGSVHHTHPESDNTAHDIIYNYGITSIEVPLYYRNLVCNHRVTRLWWHILWKTRKPLVAIMT